MSLPHVIVDNYHALRLLVKGEWRNTHLGQVGSRCQEPPLQQDGSSGGNSVAVQVDLQALLAED